MNYRGEDLDLRTPQSGGEFGRSRAGYGVRGEPIWVDDTLLACCNLAFDMAATHRAGEVRLEHLVYALTSIDTAAEALESRGVRVAALRREIGGVVASDIPIGLTNGKGAPRRSEELEMLLRDAADSAQRRSAPAGVDDVVTVLLETTRDLPGLLHLRRHALARLPVEREYEPRLRRSEPVRTQVVYEPRPVWSEPVPANRTDAVQNSRIEALEQVVRSLGADLASERKAMSSLLLDIQRDVGLRREEDGRSSGGMIDRLASIEQSVEKRLGDLTRIWAHANERMQSLESALLKARGETGGTDLVALLDRLAGLERNMQAAASEGTRHWIAVNDRLKSLDAGVPAAAAGDFPRLADRIETIEMVVLERASEAATEAARLAERLKQIEDGQAAHKVQAMQLNAALAAEVNKLGAVVARQPAAGPGADRALALVEERFQGLMAMMERQRGDLAGTLAQPVGERLAAIGNVIEARQGESARALAMLGERIAAVERGLSGYVQKVSEQGTGYDEDIGHIQEALIKINTQQATLAGSLEQWRQQAGEIGIMSNRLAAIERLTMRPVQMVEQLSEKIDAMYRLTAEKVEKRNAFIYWLFGTSDWRAASWPGKKLPIRGGTIAQPQSSQPPVTRT